jgi:hypothetical protein
VWITSLGDSEVGPVLNGARGNPASVEHTGEDVLVQKKKRVEPKLNSGLREVRQCDYFFLGSDSCKHVYSAWRCYGQSPS